ncbi:MAG: hypothetical protein JW973_05820 [Bacteroidales bacterium]|nr:hypothetical protein [Bacteroidales bacterium]
MKRIACFGFTLVFTSVIAAQSPGTFYLKGMAALLQNHHEDAVQFLSDAIDYNNDDERYYLGRAGAYLKLGKFDLAMDDFIEANSILPECGDLGLAKVYTATGDIEKAIHYLIRHLQSEFKCPESVITKDTAFDPLKLTDEWHDLWQQEWYNDFDRAVNEVEFLVRKKGTEDALEYLNTIMPAFQKKAEYYALRARVYEMKENYAAAVADYSMALSLDKNKPDYYFERGVVFLKSARYRNAVDDFSKGLRFEPDKFAFYLERARANAGLMDYQAAINDVDFYLTFFSDDQQAVSLCGEMNYLNNDFLKALKYFNINLKNDPDNPEYYKARGKTYLKTKTYTYAINDLSMSLDLKPDDGETYLYLGLAKYETGDSEGACSDLQKAQRYGNTLALKYSIEYCGD